MYKKDKLQKIADALNDEKGVLCLSLWDKIENCEKAKIEDGIINFTFLSIKYCIIFEENKIRLLKNSFEEDSFPVFIKSHNNAFETTGLVETVINLLETIMKTTGRVNSGYIMPNDDVLNKAIIEYYTED